MRRLINRCVLGLSMLLALASCRLASPAAVSSREPAQGGDAATQVGVATHGGPLRDHVSFVDHLRAAGLIVAPVREARQPFLRVKGTTLGISGGAVKQPAEIQSFDYDAHELGLDAAETAAADAGQVGPDGNPKGGRIFWAAAPHFFRKERVIVIYAGDDSALLKVLQELLGPQFAGR